MKNPNELKKIFWFNLNECEALKEYLEEMAQNGWKLKNITTYSCVFEKIEPQKLYYAVEVFSKASTYDTVPAPATLELIDYCRAAGWEFVCNIGQVNIFVSDSEKALPIETDEQLKLKTIVKGTLKQRWSIWFFLFPVMLLNTALSFLSFEFTVTSNMGLLTVLFCIMFFCIVIFQITGFIVWTTKQKRRIKNGEPIQYISKQDLKIRAGIRLALTSVFIAALLVIPVWAFLQEDTATGAIMLSLVVLLIPGIFIAVHFSQKGKYSRTVNIVIPVIFGIAAAFIIGILTIVFLLFFILGRPPSGHLVRESGTFLASSEEYRVDLNHREYHNPPDSEPTEEGVIIWSWGDDDTGYCYFDIFRSRYGFIINQYLRSKKHIFFTKNYEKVYRPEWGAVEVFTIFDGERTFVVYDDYVVSFWSDCPLTKEIVDEIISRP